LDECRIIVEVVDAIVDRIVFRVSAWRPLRARLEAAVLDCVIVARLWMPFQVIAEVVDFSSDFLELRGICGQVGIEVTLLQPVVLSQALQRLATQEYLAFVFRSEVVPLPLRAASVGNRISVLCLVLTVKNERDFEHRGHLWRQLLLSENKWLKWME